MRAQKIILEKCSISKTYFKKIQKKNYLLMKKAAKSALIFAKNSAISYPLNGVRYLSSLTKEPRKLKTLCHD
jgi:hypothetical protein